MEQQKLFYRIFSELKEVKNEYGTKHKIELTRVGMYDISGKWIKWLSFAEFHDLMSRSKVHFEIEREHNGITHQLF